jgi:hypothetical protein
MTTVCIADLNSFHETTSTLLVAYEKLAYCYRDWRLCLTQNPGKRFAAEGCFN